MNSKVEIVAPVWGQHNGTILYGNWHIRAKGIECRVDADGASVYVFRGTGAHETRVLAHDIEGAWDAVKGIFVRDITLEIERLNEDIRRLRCDIKKYECDIEESEMLIDEAEDEIASLYKKIENLKQSKPFELATEPEHLKNHPRLFA